MEQYSRQTLSLWMSLLSAPDKPGIILYFFLRLPFRLLSQKCPKQFENPRAELWEGLPFPLVVKVTPERVQPFVPCQEPRLRKGPPHYLHMGLSCQWVQLSPALGSDSGRSDSIHWIEGLPMLRDLKLDLPAVFWFCRHVLVCSILEYSGCWNIYETCSLK